MATKSSSQAIEPSPRRVKPTPAPSRRMVAYAMGWLFGWPLLIYAYNPLAAPYDPLTLLIVIPGGTLWLFLCLYFYGYLYETFFAWAEARWRVATTIREILGAIPELVMYILCFMLP